MIAGRHDDLADADDHHDPGELQELRDLVDVGGHPRHQHAPTLGVLGQHRQVVHVPERIDAQLGKARSLATNRRTRIQ